MNRLAHSTESLAVPPANKCGAKMKPASFIGGLAYGPTHAAQDRE